MTGFDSRHPLRALTCIGFGLFPRCAATAIARIYVRYKCANWLVNAGVYVVLVVYVQVETGSADMLIN